MKIAAPRRVWSFCALVAVLAAPCGFALSPAELPANYIASHWDTESGLPHNAVKAIFQSRDGYIWVGTQQGLARFDGLAFTVFTQHNTPSFPNNQVTSFAETGDGSLWIGTSFGLARYQNGRFTSYGRADGLKADTINSVCVAPDGSLWIGGREGITRWVDGKFVNDIDTSGYDMLGLRSIVVDRHKSIWLSDGFDAIRYAGGKLTRFSRAAGLPAQQLQMICEDAAGRILAVTQSGMFRLDRERFVPLEQSGSFSSQIAHTALTDRDGNLWVGSVSGLDRYLAGHAVPYVDRGNNRLNVVDALFEDREGSLWIGTSAGLFRFTNRRASTLSALDGLGGTLALAVTQTRDGAVWISTWAGGVDRFLHGVKTHYTQGAPLSQLTTTAIYQAPDGTMWLGNRGSSLDRLEGNKVTTFVYQPGVLSSRPVTAIYAAPDGEFLLGISKRGLLQLRDGKISAVPEAAEFAPETVWTLNRLHDGRLLMGTSKGLYERAADRRWRPVPLPGVPGPVVVRALLEENDGTVWLATDGQGLVRWANGKARAYDVRAGMVDDTLFSVVADDSGSLWVSSARGIARIRRSEFPAFDRGALASINSLTFGRVDGLLSASGSGNGAPAAVRLADGRIMTATDNGVAVIAPQSLQTNGRPPPVVIEDVVADDQRLPLGGAVTVPPGANRLEIRYTALSLIAPERLRFRYQLEGSDPGWVDAGHERRAHYTHLSPGRYTFRVIACNNDGVWSDLGATLAITMRPRLFQTWWFRCAAAGLVLAALAGLVGWRLRHLTRRQLVLAQANAELDQRVQVRTAELQGSLVERGRAEAALRASEEKFSLAFRLHPDALSIHRLADGAWVELNPGFTKITGYAADDLAAGGTLFSDWGLWDDPKDRELLRAGLSERGEISGVEGPLRRKDGSVIRCLTSARIMEIGGVTCVLAITRDLTVQKRLETQLAQARKMEAVGQLAGGIAHDYNNVLTATLMQLELLLERTDLAPPTRDALKELERMANRSASLTRQLLAFSRQQVMQRLPINLNDVLGNLFTMLRRLLGENIELVFQFSEEALLINADLGMIEQLVTNLCVNARDAMMPRGGRLTLRTGATVLGELPPGAPPEAYLGRFAFLSIADTGCGMDAATLAHVFEPFFTTKEMGRGTGLGLATVYGIAQQHRGWVEVESEPGAGSLFRIMLPALPDSAVVPAPPVAPAVKRGRETILLVEDEEAVRQVVGTSLRRCGYQVHEAGDGKQAVQQWTGSAGEIDLLLSDMVMPNGISGLDLVEHFRRANPNLRVILSSGYSAELNKLEAPNCQGIEYLAKPFTMGVLTDLVRKCLDAAG